MTAPHDDGRGYRDVIAEMRWDMAEQVTVSFRNRAPRWMSAWYKDARRLRATIRRIRALDAVVERARDRDYMARVWMYIACGKTQLEAATLARAEMAAQEPRR